MHISIAKKYLEEKSHCTTDPPDRIKKIFLRNSKKTPTDSSKKPKQLYLSKNITAHVIESHAPVNQLSALLALIRAIHIGQDTETEARRTRRVNEAVHVHVGLRGVERLAYMLVKLVVGDCAPEGRLHVFDGGQASVERVVDRVVDGVGVAGVVGVGGRLGDVGRCSYAFHAVVSHVE